jgi:hypothetical protein
MEMFTEFWFAYSLCLLFSEKICNARRKDNFGGVTIEILMKKMIKTRHIEASRLYYDQNNNLVKSISKINLKK